MDCSTPRSPARSFRACRARRRSRLLRRSTDTSRRTGHSFVDGDQPTRRMQVRGGERLERWKGGPEGPPLRILDLYEVSISERYGTSTIGAVQNATLWPAGSSTVTWQS